MTRLYIFFAIFTYVSTAFRVVSVEALIISVVLLVYIYTLITAIMSYVHVIQHTLILYYFLFRRAVLACIGHLHCGWLSQTHLQLETPRLREQSRCCRQV